MTLSSTLLSFLFLCLCVFVFEMDELLSQILTYLKI